MWFFLSYAYVLLFFFFNDTATTEIYTYLTHSFPTRRSSDLFSCAPRTGIGIRPAEQSSPNSPKSISRVAIIYRSSMRSEEHTSELQSLMRISYAVFCLKTKTKDNVTKYTADINCTENKQQKKTTTLPKNKNSVDTHTY